MDKRRFLQSGAALIGIAALVRYLPWKREAIAAPMEAETFEVTKTETEWQAALTPEQYRVLRQKGTERPGSSKLDHLFEEGIYSCAACDLPLFTSDTKFNSGTGWPSFYAPIKGAIATSVDNSFFITRTEVHCHRCGGHLGHVFKDGPAPTGDRYCMNGVALKFTAS
jgi:peptide-methionine (R)-S-oxide reductase